MYIVNNIKRTFQKLTEVFQYSCNVINIQQFPYANLYHVTSNKLT